MGLRLGLGFGLGLGLGSGLGQGQGLGLGLGLELVEAAERVGVVVREQKSIDGFDAVLPVHAHRCDLTVPAAAARVELVAGR